MKLAIMQPYFFPYVGYFSLIKSTDLWIFLDSVQFIRHGWIERNRVLNSKGEWHYIKVPLIKHSRDTLIKDIKIRQQEPWVDTIFAQLTCYKRKAPFYTAVIEFLRHVLTQKTESVTHLNAALVNETCNFIGIKFNYRIFSDENIEIDKVNDAGEWALNISIALGAKQYINPINGQQLFSKEKFEKNGITLSFLRPILKPYNQKNPNFEPGLSIIDVLMFNGPEGTRQMLDNFEII